MLSRCWTAVGFHVTVAVAPVVVSIVVYLLECCLFAWIFVCLCACLLVLVMVRWGFSGGSGCLCCQFVVTRGITACLLVVMIVAVLLLLWLFSWSFFIALLYFGFFLTATNNLVVLGVGKMLPCSFADSLLGHGVLCCSVLGMLP